MCERVNLAAGGVVGVAFFAEVLTYVALHS